MKPNRTHNRQSFYKYVTASTGRVVLESKTLRWSAPSLFNDPFDVPIEIFDGIDEASVREATIIRMKALVENPTLPHAEHHTSFTRLLLNQFSLADISTKKQFLDACEESRKDPDTVSEGLRLFRQQWKSMHGEQRILCLTERWDSASMWDRYSDAHKGVVLELGCRDNLDSAWLIAKPVRYTDEPLHSNTAQEFAESLFYTPDFVIPKIIEEHTHTKTTDWAYEKEWRVASWKRPLDEGAYTDYEFSPEELVGVIFGTAMPKAEKTALAQLIKERYPHTNLYQASIDGGRNLKRQFLGTGTTLFS